MKLNIILLALSFFSATFMCKAQQTDAQALIGVTVFNGEGEDLHNMTILIEAGKIKSIFKTGTKALSTSVKQIVLTGHYVIPGLIDSHVHMGMRELSRSPDASRKEFERWIYHGVTAVRDMGGDARAIEKEIQLIKTNQVPGPEIYYAATAGSNDMIAKDLRLQNVTKGIGIQNSGYIIEAKADMDIAATVAKAVQTKVSGVKFYAGIPADLIKAISTEAHKQGLKSWSHFTVFPDRPLEIVKAGVDVVSHVWGAFWQDEDVDPSLLIPFTHTDFKGARSAVFPSDLSRLNTDSPELQTLFSEMRKRGVIWDLTYVVPNPQMQKIYKQYALAASAAGVTFCTGTDYFNDITEPYPAVFKEIEQLVADSILTEKQAIIAATLNGAKAIGIETTHGTIEAGKVANLVVLKKNPTEQISNLREIVFTMKAGIVFKRSSGD